MPDPNKIEGGRWDRVLRSIFNLKGAGSTAARIAEDISATFNFPYHPEHDFLIGDRLLWGRMLSGPTVAQNARCILTNTSDNKLLIVEGIRFSVGAGTNPYIGVSSAAQPFIAAIPVFDREGRWGPLEQDIGAGASRLQEGTLVGAPLPVIQSFSTAIGAETFVAVDIILKPNDHFFLSVPGTNSLIVATFYWREHLMEPSEVA